MTPLTIYDKSVVHKPNETNIESAFTLLESPETKLTQKQVERLSRLCKKLGISCDAFESSDLDRCKALVIAIQSQVVTDDHQILSSSSIRDLSSLIGAITALVRLFTASQKTIDDAKIIDEIFSAVMAAISCLSPEQQKPFFEELKNPRFGMLSAPLDGGAHGE